MLSQLNTDAISIRSSSLSYSSAPHPSPTASLKSIGGWRSDDSSRTSSPTFLSVFTTSQPLYHSSFLPSIPHATLSPPLSAFISRYTSALWYDGGVRRTETSTRHAPPTPPPSVCVALFSRLSRVKRYRLCASTYGRHKSSCRHFITDNTYCFLSVTTLTHDY